MMPMPHGEMPAEEQAPQQAPGGASKLVADIHDGLLKLMDMFQSAKLPDRSVQALGQVISAYQAVVDDLGKPADQEEQGEPAQGPTPMEAGGAQVKPV